MQNTTSSRQWRTGWNGASRPTPSSLPSTKTTLLGLTWPGRGHFAHTQVSPSTRAAGALMMRQTLSVRRRRNKERDEYETESYRFDRVKRGELDQGDALLIEKLLNIPLMIVSLLQRKHTSIRRMKELLLGMNPSTIFRQQVGALYHSGGRQFSGKPKYVEFFGRGFRERQPLRYSEYQIVQTLRPDLCDLSPQILRGPKADDLQIDFAATSIAQGEVRDHDLVALDRNHRIGAGEAPCACAAHSVWMALECFMKIVGEVALQLGIEQRKAAEVGNQSALIVERKDQPLASFNNDGFHSPLSAERQGGEKNRHLQTVTPRPSKQR